MFYQDKFEKRYVPRSDPTPRRKVTMMRAIKAIENKIPKEKGVVNYLIVYLFWRI
jgi:hypothetical protein